VFGYARLPPDVGSIIIPDIDLDYRRFGEVTVRDALISSDLTHVFH